MKPCSADSSNKNRVETRMARLGVSEADLQESFARSSGPGGQHVNKVSTAVTLRHAPSGTSVCVQDSRSQSANRQIARERLLDTIEAQQKAERTARRSVSEKRRRQNSKRPRALKEKILRTKKKRSETKKLRAKSPKSDW